MIEQNMSSASKSYMIVISQRIVPRYTNRRQRSGLLSFQIRRNYRNLATKHHPDKGGDPDRFQLIKKAYGILSDGGAWSRLGRQTNDAIFLRSRQNITRFPPLFT